MKKRVVRIARLHHVEFERNGDTVRATFTGLNSNGRDTKLKVDVPWSFLSYIVRDLGKAWETEKTDRKSLIDRVDTALMGARHQ